MPSLLLHTRQWMKDRVLCEGAVVVFFFFQAEDGIRDDLVTGVQTCALPISIDCFWQKRGRFVGAWTPKHFASQERRLAGLNDAAQSGAFMVPREHQREERSEERRVGKECRSRWSPYH